MYRAARVLRILAPVLLATSLSAGPPPASAQDSTRHYRVALEAIGTVYSADLLQATLDQVLSGFVAQNAQFKAHERAFRTFFGRYFQGDSLRNALALLYAETFSDNDLREIIRFYRSPAGKRLVRATPTLAQRGAAFGRRIFVDHLPEFAEMIRRPSPTGGPASDEPAASGAGEAVKDTMLKHNASVLIGNGKQEFKNANYLDASRYFEAAVALDPGNPVAHYFLSRAYGRLCSPDGTTIPDAQIPYGLKSIEHARRVLQLAPAYAGEIDVLDPHSQIASEAGVMAMACLVREERDSAVWAFRLGRASGGYIDAILELNRNIMASCEPGAILLVNGDMDTFPMLYLQVVDGFRTDITVANISLLNAPWYVVELARKYPFGKNKLPLGRAADKVDSLGPIYWDSRVLTSPAPDDPRNPGGRIEWILDPTDEYNGKGILRMQDRILLRVLETNGGKRPIYFSTTVAARNRMSLDDYLSFEGLVFRLHSQPVDSLDVAALHRNCFETYSYAALCDTALSQSPDAVALVENYRLSFLRLARAYRERGEDGEAAFVLKTMNEKVPLNMIADNSQRLRQTAGNFRDEGFHQEALAIYEKALKVEPASSMIHGAIGWTYYLEGNFEKCIEASDRAVALDSLAMYARYNSALSRLCLGQLERSKALYREAKKVGDRSAGGRGADGAIRDLKNLIGRNTRREEAETILQEIFHTPGKQ